MVLPDGRSLFDHQMVAVRLFLQKERIILADEMGLGKTLTAVVAARAFLAQTPGDYPLYRTRTLGLPQN